MPFPAELRTTRRKSDGEDQLQIAIVAHLRLRPVKGAIWYMVPNGTAKSRAVAGKAKAMGMEPGVADLAFVLDNGTAAFMELKLPGKKQSEAQIAFQARCMAKDVPYVVCSELDNALEILEAWGILKPSRA